MKDKHLAYGPNAGMAKLFAAETAMHVTTKCVSSTADTATLRIIR